MKNTTTNKFNILARIFVIITAIIVFIIIGHNKRISYADEVYTYTITNAQSAFVQFVVGEWTSGEEVANSFSYDDSDSIGQLLNSVKFDKVHPPLYYILLYAVFSIFKGSMSLWIPLSINLLFYLGTILIVYQLLDEFFDNVIISTIGSIIFAFNIGILSSAMFLRMYMMLTFCIMLFTYINYLISKKEQTYRYIFLTLVTVVGFLTQYYFALFAIGCYVTEFCYNLYKKKYKSLGYYTLSMVTSVIIATVLWKEWIKSILGNVHSQAMFDKTRGIFSSFVENIYMSIKYLYGTVFREGFMVAFLVVAVLIIYLVFSKKIREKYNPTVIYTIVKIFIAANVNSVIITELAPDYLLSNRYYYAPSSQIILLCIICLIMFMKVHFARNGIVAGFVILLLANGYIFTTNNIDYYINCREYDKHTDLLKEYSDIPWIIGGNEGWIIRSTLMDFVIPEKLIMIDDTCIPKEDTILMNADKFLLLGYDDYEEFSNVGIQYYTASTGYNVEKEKIMVWNSLHVYLVKRVNR